MLQRSRVLILVCLLASAPSWGKVLLRWNQASLPPAATMGINELLVSWDADDLIASARRQGYLVYAEVPVSKTADFTGRAKRSDLTGIVFNPGDAQSGQVDDAFRQLQTAYSGLPIVVLDSNAKQPQMKGQLVIKKDGILQVTSPTAQPWIDTNLALVKLDQAFRPAQIPLYEFQWDLSDSALQEHGPDTADYALAVAEAGAFRSDLILTLHSKLEKALSQNDSAAVKVLAQIKRYADFYARGDNNSGAPEANVGVIIDSPQKAYEPINLLARHNIPFTVLKTSGLKAQSMTAFDLLVVFAALNEPLTTAISDFAAKAGIVVVVGAQGSYPWQSGKSIPAGEHSVAYATGTGRVIELRGAVFDPETFAQDIRRLLEQDLDQKKDELKISLWNALTVIAVPYDLPGGRGKVVELVNYSEESIPVQVRIKGSFSSIRYDSPERSCCESLTPVQRGAFTEFVVPALRIAGRVSLSK
jgi:hypothetical protein